MCKVLQADYVTTLDRVTEEEYWLLGRSGALTSNVGPRGMPGGRKGADIKFRPTIW